MVLGYFTCVHLWNNAILNIFSSFKFSRNKDYLYFGITICTIIICYLEM